MALSVAAAAAAGCGPHTGNIRTVGGGETPIIRMFSPTLSIPCVSRNTAVVVPEISELVVSFQPDFSVFAAIYSTYLVFSLVFVLQSVCLV